MWWNNVNLFQIIPNTLYYLNCVVQEVNILKISNYCNKLRFMVCPKGNLLWHWKKKYELQNHLGWKNPYNSMFLWYAGAGRLEEGFPSGDRGGLTISTPLYCLSARAAWSFFSLPITMEFILVIIVICRKCSGHIYFCRNTLLTITSHPGSKIKWVFSWHDIVASEQPADCS